MTPFLTLNDLFAISPLLILLGGALLLLLLESFAPQGAKKLSFWTSLAILLLGLYAALLGRVSESSLLTPWLAFDSLARFFNVFFLLIGLASVFLSVSFFKQFEVPSNGEYYFLLLSALFGLLLVGSSADFLTLFIGIETLSISLYILCGYMKKWTISHEASLKYFLMGSLATAFLIYGIALVYGATGSTRYADLLPAYQGLESPSIRALFLGGVALVTLGLAFKAAIVPFHLWAPDVYDGAPTPITAFMAVGTKVGAFAALLRVFMGALANFDPLWNEVIAWLAFPTLIYANIVALRQTELRRFFAYSGISHAGFLLIPLAAGTAEALPALLFYLIVYALATLGAFAVIVFLDKRSQGVVLYDLHGLFKRSWLAASILTLCILTLSGIPPTVGFLAKLYIFKVAFEAGYHVLVIVGLLTTVISAVYYLRIISLIFAEKPLEATKASLSWPSLAVGLASCILIIALSIYPEPILSFLLTVDR